VNASVSCVTLLERLSQVWRIDAAESTRRSLKYRRGAGEILFVNHDDRGWRDPLSEAKGDIFTLVQHLDPGLDFGEVRRMNWLEYFIRQSVISQSIQLVCLRQLGSTPLPYQTQ
jgi:hypothetical protein